MKKKKSIFPDSFERDKGTIASGTSSIVDPYLFPVGKIESLGRQNARPKRFHNIVDAEGCDSTGWGWYRGGNPRHRKTQVKIEFSGHRMTIWPFERINPTSLNGMENKGTRTSEIESDDRRGEKKR